MARWQIEMALSGGSGLANNIPQEVVKNLIITHPTKDEQDAIVVFLDQEIVQLEKLIATIRGAIGSLNELRSALISATVTGKIDVRGETA